MNKKKIYIFLGTFTAVVMLYIVVSWFVRGRVTVITGSSNAEVYYMDLEQREPILAGTGERVTISDDSGEYTVIVKKGDDETWTRAVIPNYFNGEDVVVSLRSTTTPQLVYPLFVQKLAKQGSSIRYLASTNSFLMEQNLATNTIKRLSADIFTVKDVFWISYDKAFVVGADNEILSFSNGKFSAISAFTELRSDNVEFATNGQQSVLVYDRKIYLFEDPASTPRIVAEVSSNSGELYMSNDGAILYSASVETGSDNPRAVGSVSDAETPANNFSTEQEILIYNPTGNLLSRSTIDPTRGQLSNALLTPGGKATLYSAGMSLSVYDIANKSTIPILPVLPAEINTITEVNNRILLLIDNSVWEFDSDKQSLSRLSARIEGILLPGSIYLGDDELVFSVKDSNKLQGNIYSVPLE